MDMDRYTLPASPGAPSADWRLALPEHRRRHVRVWLWSGAALTFLILVVGGITRLTQSGLSIVDWNPIMGAVPPLNEAQWMEVFDRYRQFPEYQKLRQGMTLGEFKFIFFWEYLHRQIARIIGLVFLVPFLFFLVRGYFNGPLLRRSLLLFGLGGLQGALGWYMVSSGLIDRPHVSQFRLGIHLSIAFAIFAGCVWTALDLRVRAPGRPAAGDVHAWLRRALIAIGLLFGVQVFWGALVAGLRAGRYFNTFPLMDGGWLPPDMFGLDPALLNFVENPFTVQWMHRVLGTLLLVASVALFGAARRRLTDPVQRVCNALLFGLVLAQFGLGVLTLLHAVPITLGVAHQAMAMVIFGVWLVWYHRLRNPWTSTPPTAARSFPRTSRTTAPAGR